MKLTTGNTVLSAVSIFLLVVCVLFFRANNMIAGELRSCKSQYAKVETDFLSYKLSNIAASDREAKLDACLLKAKIDANEYLKINGEVKTDGQGREIISAQTRFHEAADKQLEQDRGNCYRRYPIE